MTYFSIKTIFYLQSRQFLLKILLRNPGFKRSVDYDRVIQCLAKLPNKLVYANGPNRCNITKRQKSYTRVYGLSRFKVKQLADLGLLPGVTRSSW